MNFTYIKDDDEKAAAAFHAIAAHIYKLQAKEALEAGQAMKAARLLNMAELAKEGKVRI